MFYATRKQEIPETNITERQIIHCYTRKQRNEWIEKNGGEPITWKEKQKLKKTIGETMTDKSAGFIVFVEII